MTTLKGKVTIFVVTIVSACILTLVASGATKDNYPTGTFSAGPVIYASATGLNPGEIYAAAFTYKSDDGTRSVKGSFGGYDAADASGSFYAVTRIGAITGGKSGTATVWIKEENAPWSAGPITIAGRLATTTFRIP